MQILEIVGANLEGKRDVFSELFAIQDMAGWGASFTKKVCFNGRMVGGSITI